MLRYTGFGDNHSITVVVIGDGVSKAMNIDVKASPFLLTFPQANYPIAVLNAVDDGPAPVLTLLPQSILNIVYPTPPPVPTTAVGLSPRSQFKVWFLYQGV
jgi:hypothetical protein